MVGNIILVIGFFLVDVDVVGIYFLFVIDFINGCEVMDMVVVEFDFEMLIVVGVVLDNILGCGDIFILDGIGFFEGMIYDYEWVVVGGMGLFLVFVINLMVMVDVVGDYLFIVMNMNIGCFDIFEVVFILFDDSLLDVLV